MPRRAAFRGIPRLNLSDFPSAMNTNSRNWGPIGLGNPIATASIPRQTAAIRQLGNSNWGAIGQFNSIQINSPNSMRAIQLVGLAKEAELMPSPSCGQRAMTACVFPPSLEITDYSGRVQSFTIKDVSVAIVRYRCAIAAVVMLQSNRPQAPRRRKIAPQTRWLARHSRTIATKSQMEAQKALPTLTQSNPRTRSTSQ